ncbi:hypothetical protein M9Y10_012091 [Tritrichomonas musculus]|uniref:Uncharacterized protein n=1 Tax=Tritrichomonas musculus TaxID=1915356 RepID=A0ABR2IC72_9EUKA
MISFEAFNVHRNFISRFHRRRSMILLLCRTVQFHDASDVTSRPVFRNFFNDLDHSFWLFLAFRVLSQKFALLPISSSSSRNVSSLSCDFIFAFSAAFSSSKIFTRLSLFHFFKLK